MTTTPRISPRAIASLTVAGAILRFFAIGAQSLWLDELFSVSVARRDIGLVIRGSAEGDTNPPLFNLLLHFVVQFGADETNVRILSALFSIATIPLFYLLAMRLFGSLRIANIATLLLVISPFHIAYAQEARMYSQLAFFQVAAIYFFTRAWEDGRMRDWLLFGMAESLAFYSHSLAVLGLLALDAFALSRRDGLTRSWRGLAIAHLLVALLFAPWMLVLKEQALRVVQGFWNPSSTILNLLRTVFVLCFNSALPSLLVPLGLFVTLVLFVLSLYSIGRALLREHLELADREGLWLAVSITIIPPVALLALSLIRPIYIERVLISSSFGLLLMWAWVWVNRPRRLDRALLAAGGLLIAVALVNYYVHPDDQKPPMREAAQVLAAHWQVGDPVMHTSDWSALAFGYYLPNIPQHFLAGDPVYADRSTRAVSGLVAGLRPEDEGEVVKDHSRIWLVVALDHSEEYQQGRVSEFNSRYHLDDEIEMGRVYLMLYHLNP